MSQETFPSYPQISVYIRKLKRYSYSVRSKTMLIPKDYLLRVLDDYQEECSQTESKSFVPSLFSKSHTGFTKKFYDPAKLEITDFFQKLGNYAKKYKPVELLKDPFFGRILALLYCIEPYLIVNSIATPANFKKALMDYEILSDEKEYKSRHTHEDSLIPDDVSYPPSDLKLSTDQLQEDIISLLQILEVDPLRSYSNEIILSTTILLNKVVTNPQIKAEQLEEIFQKLQKILELPYVPIAIATASIRIVMKLLTNPALSVDQFKEMIQIVLSSRKMLHKMSWNEDESDRISSCIYSGLMNLGIITTINRDKGKAMIQLLLDEKNLPLDLHKLIWDLFLTSPNASQEQCEKILWQHMQHLTLKEQVDFMENPPLTKGNSSCLCDLAIKLDGNSDLVKVDSYFYSKKGYFLSILKQEARTQLKIIESLNEHLANGTTQLVMDYYR